MITRSISNRTLTVIASLMLLCCARASNGTHAVGMGGAGTASGGSGNETGATGGEWGVAGSTTGTGGIAAAGGVATGGADNGGAPSGGGVTGSGGSSGGMAGIGGTGGTGGTTGGTGGTTGGTGGTGGVTGPWPPSSTFSNPVLWEDLADLDVFRVGDTFYYSASNMHYSPGAPVLRSYDLVHWEFAGHSVPVLDFSSNYDLDGGQAYVKGTWASFLNYRPSNKTFYWGGCIEFSRTYIYTAAAVEGPWTKHPAINNCYYDAGLLVDDDDTLYVRTATRTSASHSSAPTDSARSGPSRSSRHRRTSEPSRDRASTK